MRTILKEGSYTILLQAGAILWLLIFIQRCFQKQASNITKVANLFQTACLYDSRQTNFCTSFDASVTKQNAVNQLLLYANQENTQRKLF